MSNRFWTYFSFALAGLGASLLAVTSNAVAQSAAAGPTHPGRAVYEAACSACHNNPEATHSPALAALRSMSAASLRAALTTGKMREQGSALAPGQLDQVVAYLAAPPPASGDAWISGNMCAADRRAIDLSGPETLTRFGVDYANSRNMPANRAGLSKADLKNLEVAWSIGLPQTQSMRASPVIIGSTMFYAASQPGYMLALDTRTGCVKWAYKSPRPLKTSVSYGPLGEGGRKALIVADVAGQVQAIDAAKGELIWSAEGRHDPRTMLTGGPILWKDRVIVPVSANDVARAMLPTYECCQGHGAVVALNAADGKRLWVAETMEAARPTGETNKAGAKLWGPSGAPVWSTPAIDGDKGVIYVGTGQNTSLPATISSDSVWAIDLATGQSKWFFQALPKDVWNMACVNNGANCPPSAASALKDFDIGASIIIGKGARGRDILLAGQKSGDVWGVDARGQKVWRQTFGEGSPLGGVHWGLASDGKRLFVPIADAAGAGLYALDVPTGKVLWTHRTTPDCGDGRKDRVPYCERGFGLSAAPLVVDTAVLAGSLDGRLLIFDAADGKLIASHDTNRRFETLNGVVGQGGSIDSHSIFAGDGMVFVGSGYATFGAPPGNVLVAYRPKR